MAKKQFALRADQIKPLAKNRGSCFATDMITVEGRKVGYMYREEPRNDQDSGWVFTAGQESQCYMDDADNHGIYGPPQKFCYTEQLTSAASVAGGLDHGWSRVF